MAQHVVLLLWFNDGQLLTIHSWTVQLKKRSKIMQVIQFWIQLEIRPQCLSNDGWSHGLEIWIWRFWTINFPSGFEPTFSRQPQRNESTNPINSLSNVPVILDIFIAFRLLGYPDTRSVKLGVQSNVWNSLGRSSHVVPVQCKGSRKRYTKRQSR